MAGEPQIQQIALEITYARGSLYYDCSGRIQRDLLEALGPPFVPAAAQGANPVVATAVASPAERLVVDFNVNRLRIQQSATGTIARFEQVAPPSWDVLGGHMEVRHQVVRCGLRFWLMWPDASAEAVEDKIVKTGLAPGTEKWNSIVGSPPLRRVFLSVHGNESDQTRYALSGGRSTIEGGEISDELKHFQVESGILLDIDRGRSFDPPGQIPKKDLKDFIRDTWRENHRVALALGELL